jgi:hypothetical protein
VDCFSLSPWPQEFRRLDREISSRAQRFPSGSWPSDFSHGVGIASFARRTNSLITCLRHKFLPIC